MKAVYIISDLPCAVVMFDGWLHCHRKVAYFMKFDEAVTYTQLISKFSHDYFAVVFFEGCNAEVVCYYRDGVLLGGFAPEINYVRYNEF